MLLVRVTQFLPLVLAEGVESEYPCVEVTSDDITTHVECVMMNGKVWSVSVGDGNKLLLNQTSCTHIVTAYGVSARTTAFSPSECELANAGQDSNDRGRVPILSDVRNLYQKVSHINGHRPVASQLPLLQEWIDRQDDITDCAELQKCVVFSHEDQTLSVFCTDNDQHTIRTPVGVDGDVIVKMFTITVFSLSYPCPVVVLIFRSCRVVYLFGVWKVRDSMASHIVRYPESDVTPVEVAWGGRNIHLLLSDGRLLSCGGRDNLSLVTIMNGVLTCGGVKVSEYHKIKSAMS